MKNSKAYCQISECSYFVIILLTHRCTLQNFSVVMSCIPFSFFNTCQHSQKSVLLCMVSLFILFLWSFACFNISITVASTGHTNTTLGNSGCLEAQIWKSVEITPSIKTKYWWNINMIESRQKSMQKSGKVEGCLQCLCMVRKKKAIQVLVNHQHSSSGTTPSHAMLVSLVDRQKDSMFQVNVQHDPPSGFTWSDKNSRNAQAH